MLPGFLLLVQFGEFAMVCHKGVEAKTDYLDGVMTWLNLFLLLGTIFAAVSNGIAYLLTVIGAELTVTLFLWLFARKVGQGKPTSILDGNGNPYYLRDQLSELAREYHLVIPVIGILLIMATVMLYNASFPIEEDQLLHTVDNVSQVERLLPCLDTYLPVLGALITLLLLGRSNQ